MTRSATPLENTVMTRFAWLVASRWLFIMALLVGPPLVAALMPVAIMWQPFVITGLMLGMVNLGWQVYWSHLTELEPRHLMQDLRTMILVQIVHDWLALLTLIHFSGGVDSPLILFFILHLALAQLALDRRQGWVATGLAIGSLACLLMAEALDVLQPVSIPGLTSELHQSSGFYVANVLVWQALVMVLLTMMLQGVMHQLRRREEAVLRTRGRLEKANRRITQQSDERVRLLHAMAHELRSPIAAAITMIKVLVMTHGEKLPEEAQHPLSRVQTRLEGLTGLINELLELAESRKPKGNEARRIELMPLLQEMLDEHRPHAQERQVRLSLQGPPDEAVLFADPHALQRALENFLSNAIKYNRDGRSVEIHVSRVADDWRIDFKDEGIGIAPDQIQRLFSEFYRTPQSRKHTTSGTGLGLAITRDLVERMGGRVEVHSEVEVGSTFSLYLPAPLTGAPGA